MTSLHNNGFIVLTDFENGNEEIVKLHGVVS